MKIELLDKDLEQKYEKFLLMNEETLFYASNKYRLLLKNYLKEKDCYFLALDDNNDILGVLPAFLKENINGNVLNSLPYYGSNGAIIEYNNNFEVKEKLIQAFYDYAKETNSISTTIITSPFESSIDFYESKTLYTFKDSRIGQITKLPEGHENVEKNLFNLFYGVKRTDIRKARKNNITVDFNENNNVFEFLKSTHYENMNKINGIAKTKEFFNLIPQIFEYGKDYKIFTAYLNGEAISAVLLFYYNKTVEYFTPVVVEKYRSYQGLSLIIFEAMKDAIKNGYKCWNWGGTWFTQDGVYNFKKKWGTQDKNYFYYTRIFDNSIVKATRQELLSKYPYFYVLPFGELKS